MNLPAVLSEGFLKAMPEEERRRLGAAGLLQEDKERMALEKERKRVDVPTRDEKALQRDLINWLHLHGHYFVRARMDKKTTVAKGTPDFIVCVKPAGFFLGIETKRAKGTLTPEQAKTGVAIRASHGRYIVARNLQDVIDAIDNLNAQ